MSVDIPKLQKRADKGMRNVFSVHNLFMPKHKSFVKKKWFLFGFKLTFGFN